MRIAVLSELVLRPTKFDDAEASMATIATSTLDVTANVTN
jgi:hypothetical protein